MKKVGYFFASFLPFLITCAVQILALMFMSGVAIFGFILKGQHGSDDILSSFLDVAARNDFSACIMLIYALTCAIIFGLWYYSTCGGDFLPSPSRTFSVAQIAGVILLVPGMQFFTSYLISIVSAIVPKWLEQYQNLMDQSGLDSNIGIIMLCYGVIIGPICEELAFRGVTMRLAQQALPFWLANLLQAALFGIFHMNWIQGIYAFTLGIVLGLVCHYGNSIYYSILFHILFNFWGLVLAEKFFGNLEETTLLGILIFVSMIVFLAAGAFLFFFGTHKKKQKYH